MLDVKGVMRKEERKERKKQEKNETTANVIY